MLRLNINKIFLVLVFFLLKKTKEHILSHIFTTLTRIMANTINYVLINIYNYYVVHIHLSEWGIIVFSVLV